MDKVLLEPPEVVIRIEDTVFAESDPLIAPELIVNFPVVLRDATKVEEVCMVVDPLRIDEAPRLVVILLEPLRVEVKPIFTVFKSVELLETETRVDGRAVANVRVRELDRLDLLADLEW